MSSCLDSAGEDLEWKSVKSEIREQFPSVAQLSTQELANWLSTDSGPLPLLLDARAPQEYAVSHLPNAILTSSEAEVLERLKRVEQDRPVVIYCSVGYRSSRLAEILGELGYKNVYNLEGSIFQWANEGRAVYRGREPVEVVHPYDDRWGKLLRRELWSYEP
jgi:rhodanese-related sulfurtransferase